VCALDLGKARVGVAVTDDLGLYAHARAPLDGRRRKSLLAAIARLAHEEQIERFLVGLPLAMSGEHGLAARLAMAFAEEVANATGLEVELVDERLSTVEAQAQLHASGRTAREFRAQVDGVSAAVVLQSWLDARRAADR
jgi:putative Holliday junction resolvase